MEIGGFFPYHMGNESDNHYVERMCPGAEDTVHLMSGRCAIYYCVQDISFIIMILMRIWFRSLKRK